MNRVIIIGNGFDKAHQLPTGYTDFINHYWETVSYKIFRPYDRWMAEHYGPDFISGLSGKGAWRAPFFRIQVGRQRICRHMRIHKRNKPRRYHPRIMLLKIQESVSEAPVRTLFVEKLGGY